MSKEIAKKENNQVAVPEYLKQFQGEGAEDISADMIEKSFLSMAHEDKEGVKLGEWYDSATGESFGKEVVVTVCKISRTWRRFNADFQLDAQSKDGMNWDNGDALNEGEKWQCAFIDMFVLINESNSAIPFIVSFKSTSFRTGKKLATTIAKFTKGNGEPIFARNYTLYTEEAKKGIKTYSLAKYKLNSGFNDEETVNLAARVRKMVQNIDPVMTEMTDSEPDNSSDVDFGEDGLD